MDVIFGYLIDGWIGSYDLKILKDDKNFFLLYNVSVVVMNKILKVYLKLKLILN